MIIGSQVTNPGDLRTPVALYGATALTADAGGAQKPSRVKLADVWVKWTNVHGNEVWTSQAAKAVKPATVLMRYRDDFDETCAIEKEGEEYEVVSIDDIRERHEYLEVKVQLAKGSS